MRPAEYFFIIQLSNSRIKDTAKEKLRGCPKSHEVTERTPSYKKGERLPRRSPFSLIM